MSFLDLAKNRYTTKTYSDKKIDANKIEELKEILRLRNIKKCIVNQRVSISKDYIRDFGYILNII